jgi:nucleoside-diphosphate-sugar epimerase
MNRVFVTGATGVLGRRVVPRLVAAGHDVPGPTRGEHRTALAAAAGRERLRDLPGLVEKMGGAAAESLARSHRISSASLISATGWTPAHRPIDRWRELT